MRRGEPAFRVGVRQNLRPAPFEGRRIRELALRAAPVLGASSADVRILIVGDPEMARWNERFLGHGGTTNVISFPEEEPVEGVTHRIAGDILISAPTCLRQTEGWNGSPEERVFFFVLHAMLHLIGYDHVGDRAAARRMRSIERRAYRTLVGEPGA